jgi:hypothetical protein
VADKQHRHAVRFFSERYGRAAAGSQGVEHRMGSITDKRWHVDPA